MAIALHDPADRAQIELHSQHLASCSKCTVFKHQLAFIAEAARQSSAAFDQEPSQDFETRILRRLCS
jgi:hypothetical protein